MTALEILTVIAGLGAILVAASRRDTTLPVRMLTTIVVAASYLAALSVGIGDLGPITWVSTGACWAGGWFCGQITAPRRHDRQRGGGVR